MQNPMAPTAWESHPLQRRKGWATGGCRGRASGAEARVFPRDGLLARVELAPFPVGTSVLFCFGSVFRGRRAAPRLGQPRRLSPHGPSLDERKSEGRASVADVGKQRVPRLRKIFRFANDLAPLGMTIRAGYCLLGRNDIKFNFDFIFHFNRPTRDANGGDAEVAQLDRGRSAIVTSY